MKEKEELIEQLKTIKEKLESKELEEFNSIVSPMKEQINDILGEEYVCGVVMNKNSALKVIEALMQKQNSVFIPYQIYKK